MVLCSHLIGFRSQTIPERFIGFNELAGIGDLQKKSDARRSIEAGDGGVFRNSEGGVKSLFGAKIRSGVDDRLDSLFLFRE